MKKHVQNFTVVFLSVMIIIMTAFVSLLVYICFFYDGFENAVELQKLEHIQYVEYVPDDLNVKPLGRTTYKDEIRKFSYSGSGVEFFCKGEYVTVTICGYQTMYQNDNQKARYAVYLNGRLFEEKSVTGETEQITVDISPYKNGVSFKIVKLSEAQFSSMGVGKIGIYGEYTIAPAKESDLKIEFIGDSITCGYGLDEENQYGYFSTKTENFLKTYAYLTASELRADYSVVAFSGYGVYSGFTSGKRNSDDVIFKYYERTDLVPFEENYWDFNSAENNLVVINLGTNDASYCGGSAYGREIFKNEYITLLKLVREKNPSAYILCILGDMNNSMYTSIEKAVSEYSAETYDYDVSASTISFDMGNTDIVVDGHPGKAANEKASKELINIIRDLIDTEKIKR